MVNVLCLKTWRRDLGNENKYAPLHPRARRRRNPPVHPARVRHVFRDQDFTTCMLFGFGNQRVLFRLLRARLQAPRRGGRQVAAAHQQHHQRARKVGKLRSHRRVPALVPQHVKLRRRAESWEPRKRLPRLRGDTFLTKVSRRAFRALKKQRRFAPHARERRAGGD